MGRGDAPTLEVVDEYDADGDGRVTREEYLAGFLRDGIDLHAKPSPDVPSPLQRAEKLRRLHKQQRRRR